MDDALEVTLMLFNFICKCWSLISLIYISILCVVKFVIVCLFHTCIEMYMFCLFLVTHGARIKASFAEKQKLNRQYLEQLNLKNNVKQNTSTMKYNKQKDQPNLGKPIKNSNKQVYLKKSVESKDILERWLKANKSYPYATQTELVALSELTNLKIEQIQRWLSNKRKRSKELRHNGEAPSKGFTITQKNILNQFFTTKTNKPNLDDITNLANILQADKKAIKQWFINKRRRHLI